MMLIAAVSLAATQAKAENGTLTVYTYDSFVADWGPGPQVEAAFEAQCDCDLEFVSAADGVALLNRLRLEGGNGRADIVLGLDTNLTEEATAAGFFVEHGQTLSETSVPGGWDDKFFLPFDYGYFAVIYDSETISEPPTSMAEFLAADASNKIVIQDPRTSTPGLGLMLWLREIYGDEWEEALAKLNERTLTVTPGWSEAYGLFTNGEVPMVLSYTTSPAYHILAEEIDRYKAATFEEGHYMQIEVAGITTKGADNPLSTVFMEFMVSSGFQSIIPETNWMLPVADTGAELDPAFLNAIPEKALLLAPETVAAQRKQWVDEWLGVMSR
ncbi:MAG: thiamine ABC transporter substrate binding subunit [Pseudomonadota bacterium]